MFTLLANSFHLIKKNLKNLINNLIKQKSYYEFYASFS